MLIVEEEEAAKGPKEKSLFCKNEKKQKKWRTEKAHIFLPTRLAGGPLQNIFMTHQRVSTTAKGRWMKMPSICEEGQQQRC